MLDIKTINPLILEKCGPKNKIYSQYYELCNQSRSNINHKYDIWNCGSWPAINNLGRFGLKIAMRPIFMKFGAKNKSDILIMNIVLEIDDLVPKL